jgi:hypothetical protein
MKYCFLFLFFHAIVFHVFAQEDKRDLGLKDSSFSWGAEYESLVNLTPKPGGISLKKWYLEKLRKSFVNAFDLDTDENVTGTHRVKADLTRPVWLTGYNTKPQDNVNNWFFENAKTNAVIHVRPLLKADSCCGCDESDAFFIKQLLLYKKGRFSVRNIFLSPLCAREDRQGSAAWYALGNFAFNTTLKKPSTAQFIASSYVKYQIDSVINHFSRGVSPTSIAAEILHDISIGNLLAFDPDTKERIPYKKLLTWKLPADTMVSTNGKWEVTEYQVVQKELQPDDFGALKILIKWYFDFKNEKLYSEIGSVMLMRKLYSGDGIYLGLTPFCNIRP